MKEPRTEQALRAWNMEMVNGNWATPNELKTQFKHASILTNKRVVFNICGNKFRLIADIEY